MRYFLDTEFNEEVDPIEMISIGVVSEDGREFYAIDQEYHDDSPKWASCHEWVRRNVKPLLLPETMKKLALIEDRASIRDGLRNFVGNDPYPEFWGYFADYDWFLVCRLFGSFAKMPKNWANICYDVKQFQKNSGVGKLPTKFDPEHNSLVDARWTKYAFDYVKRVRDSYEDATAAAFGQPAGKRWP